MQRGIFIALEGNEGSGTTTQSALLRSELEKMCRRVHVTKEPTDNAIGKLLRKMLQADESQKDKAELMALLFAADRVEHCQKEIIPALQRGEDVISDRYLLSSLVYQGLELPTKFVEKINAYALKPDVTCIVDIPVEVGLDRLKMRGGIREIFDAQETQIKVRNRYLQLGKQYGAAIIDGNCAKEEVTRHLVEVVRHALR